MPANGKRKRYTDDFRASVVLMLEAAGYFKDPPQKGALTRVARKVGVPHPTVSRWGRAVQNPPPNELVQEKKAGLLKLMGDMLHDILAEMGVTMQDATFQQLATAYGIIFDKVQLLEGKPTERVENLTSEQRRDRVAELFELARDRGVREPAS